LDKSYRNLSGVYDELMYDINYDAWADYLAMLLKKHVGEHTRILEAACGTGSLSIRLKKRGFDVTATDISEEMIEIAIPKAREAGVSISFACQDMRRLESTPKHAVLACCDGVNYLTDDNDLRDFFSAAYRCLKRRGVLLFDISSSYKLRHTLGNELYYEIGDEITYLWKNTFSESNQCVRMELTFFRRDGEHYLRSDEEHLQKAHETEHLKKLLLECGFQQVYAYSFQTENNCTEQDERIQFVAIKNKNEVNK